MFKTGKCPACGQVPITHIHVEDVDVQAVGGTTWKGVVYVCPNMKCKTILGVGIDPVALKTATVNEVVKNYAAVANRT